MARDLRRAVAARDAGFVRVRRTTGIALLAGTALTAALTAVAGASTHFRKSTPRPARQASPAATPVTAPAPPLVAAHTAPVPPASSAPAPTPAPSSSPPVVVSGGS